ncbi:MAG: hypothetical protein ACI9GH_000327 [Candidatus Paceibacteria bacterium]|jgi:hypothetical protein
MINSFTVLCLGFLMLVGATTLIIRLPDSAFGTLPSVYKKVEYEDNVPSRVSWTLKGEELVPLELTN